MLSTQSLIASAEIDLIRAVVQNHDELVRVADLNADYFVNPVAQAIWRVIARNPETQPTASWLADELRSFGEGRQAITTIAGAQPEVQAIRAYLWGDTRDAGEVETHGEQVREHHKFTQIERLYSQSHNLFMSADDRARDLILGLQKILSNSGNPYIGHDSLTEGTQKALSEYYWMCENPGKMLGWRMGDPGYDKLMGASDGVKGERLNVTMALTSHGKSVWLLKHALGYAQTKSDEFGRYPKVLYISVEMSSKQISRRLIAQLAKVNLNEISRDPDAREKIKAAEQTIAQLDAEGRLQISEENNVDKIIREATRRRLREEIDILVIDYIGGLSGGSGGDRANSYMLIGGIVEALRNACHELDLPIITAHQLNRAAYSSGKPTLENTADSSKVSHVAHTVQMFWRPSLTHPKIMGTAAGIWQDVVIVTCEKNRSGPRRDLHYDINPVLSTMTPVPSQKLRQLQSEEEQARLRDTKG